MGERSKVMIISGAGLSAQSGIKTFRDADGLWENYDVMEVCSIEGWHKNRALVTQFYNARRKDLEDKVPNAMHYAIARLQEQYSHRILHLTQNVDDLCERAGADGTLHLHGTLTDLRCEACGEVFYVGYAEQKASQLCSVCHHDALRHNVVMFGEAAPMYKHIYEAIAQCDMFIAIGTSSQVVDVVAIAQEFSKSVVINPKREIYHGGYTLESSYVDENFTHVIALDAVAAVDEFEALIVEHLTC